jgi:hypothetical protein
MVCLPVISALARPPGGADSRGILTITLLSDGAEVARTTGKWRNTLFAFWR